MAGKNDSDPFERFFRPRPGEGASDEPESGTAEDGEAARSDRPDHPDEPAAPAGQDDDGSVSSGGAHSARGPAPGRAGRAARGTAAGAHRQRMVLLVSGVMSVLVLATSGGAWMLQDYVMSRVQRVDAFGGLAGRPAAGAKGALNILVAGVDRREGISPDVRRKLRLGRQEGQRSDTMMLIHLSENHDKATVLSLPRDSLVTIPAHRGAGGRPQPEQRNKLNTAFSWGGHKLAIQTIERNTGIRIDHYVEINFLGFIKVVDALGGVQVCSPTRIRDNKSGLSLDAGKHVVDGATALAYVRTRYTLSGGSDLGRVERQQQFVASMIHRALDTRTLTDPGKLSAFLNASLAAVRLDERLSKEVVGRLAQQLKGISTDSVTFTTVPMTNPGQMIKDLGSVALWDPQRSRDLFAKIKKDVPVIEPARNAPPARHNAATPTPPGTAPTVPPSRIEVRVLNGTTTSGLGAKAAADLREAGFVIDGVPANATSKGATRTVIQYGPARRDSAATLDAAIPGARLRAVPSLGSRVRVVVGSSWAGAERVQVTVPGQPPAGGGQGPGGAAQARTATQNACR